MQQLRIVSKAAVKLTNVHFDAIKYRAEDLASVLHTYKDTCKNKYE